MNKYFLVPQILSAVRIVFAFLFFYLFLNNLVIETMIFFHIGWFTDILDGISARKLNVASNFGGYFDAVADFILIFVAFFTLVIKEIFPFWVLIIIGLMFLQFIITSKIERPIYDPIGRYSGVFLFVIIGISITFPDTTLYFYLLISIIGFAIIALISRIIALTKKVELEDMN